MRATIYSFLRGEVGTTSVEYAVILALIVVVVISSVGVVGARAGGYWGDIRSQFATYGIGGG